MSDFYGCDYFNFTEQIKSAEHITAIDNYTETKVLGHFDSYEAFRKAFPSAEITCVEERVPGVFDVYC